MLVRFAITLLLCLSFGNTVFAAIGKMPENLAPKAKISASSEYDQKYAARFVADGIIVGPRSGGGAGWAAKGSNHEKGVQLTFEWKTAVSAKEIVFYRRATDMKNEAWKNYRLFLNDDKEPFQTGTLQKIWGPQQIVLKSATRPLPKKISKIVIDFTSCYDGPNPGALEVQIFAESLDKKTLLSFYEAALKAGQPKKPVPARIDPQILADVGCREIIFTARKEAYDGHWYANFSYYAESDKRKAYATTGRLCKLDVLSGKITTLIDDPQGTIRDPQVHYDGQKVIFCWRKTGSDNFHLYEIGVDGTNLRQLTDGGYDDLEPTYLPNGDIMFVSSRCKRWVNCWLTQVATLHSCDANGENIRQISANIEQDNTPWPLPDGRILYQRWEYVDRSQVHYHHLWTTNPDGSGQTVFYGNMHPGIVMIDAKPIPGTDKVLSLFSPGHGRKEHAGALTIVSPKSGPDNQGSARQVLPGNDYRDPYVLTPDLFMVAERQHIRIIESNGKKWEFYTLSAEWIKQGLTLHEPRPVRPRARERIVAPVRDNKATTGTLILADVYNGRNMKGVKRGDIKKLLILETLPKPINYTGGMEPLSYGGTFTLERIMGTVPVEEDGSAYFEVPAMRGFFFVALDKDERSIKRMQSFMSVVPGENLSCVGCHEPRTRAPMNHGQGSLLALKRQASKIEPIAGVPEVFDFPRDIQPILDRHCIKCHDYDKRKGRVILTGDRGPLYSHSYYTLSVLKQIADGRNLAVSNRDPLTIGAQASPVFQKVYNPDGKTHHNVNLSAHEIKMMRYWLESAAPYPGTYASLGSGMVGGYAENRIDRVDISWPSMQAAQKTMNQRCVSCHTDKLNFSKSPTDNAKMPPWDIKYGDPRLRFTRHIMFNLSRPDKSLMLLGPLAKEARGYGACMIEDKNSSGTVTGTRPVFDNTNDPDYKILLTAINDTKKHLDTIKRFDMPGFRAPQPYLRELKRYGVLADNVDATEVLDVYELDCRYWRSLWLKPDIQVP